MLFFSNFYEELSSKSDAIIKNYITGSSFDNKESLKLIKFSTSENKITFTYSCINQNYISGRSKFNLDEITTPEQIPTFNFIDYLWNADKNFAELFYTVETSINLNKESLTKRKSESASKGGAELETFESLIKNALKNTNAFFETNTFLEQDEIKKCLDMTKIVIKDLKLN